MKIFSIIANDTNKVRLCVFALMAALIFGFSNPMEVAAQAIPDSEMDMGSEPSQELQTQEEWLAPLEQEALVCTAPPDDMTGWWPMDEQSGTTVSDIAGYANNGSRINNPTPITGKVDRALSFNGSNHYVEVPDHNDLDVGTHDFSVDAWVKTTDRSGVKVVVDKRYESRSGNVQGYTLFLNSGQLAFQLADGNGSWFCSVSSSSSCTNFTSGVSVADGRWHLVAVTVDRNSSNGGRFYVDGRLVRTFNPTGRQGSLDNNKPLRIGSRSSFTTGLFRGEIDEVELFKRALSSSEISDIYRAGSAGKCKEQCVAPPSGMTGWWPLDEQSGTTVSDIAGHANNGSRINNPTPVTGKVDRALSLNGSYVEVQDHNDLDVGQGDFSIDAWVKTTDRGGVKVVVDKRYESHSGNVQGYALYLDGGRLGFQLADGNGTWFCSGSSSSSCTNFNSGVSVADGQWHLVAVTVDRNSSTGGRFYVDGSLVRTFNPTGRQGSLDNNKPLRIGSRSSFETGLFQGYIDEVELFKRVLTSQEILSIYQAGSAGKCKTPSQPEAIYVSSSTGGNVDGISFRDEDVLVFNPATDGWALYFDGSDVGISNRDVNALHVLNDGDILMSLNAAKTLGGTSYDDSDIVRFSFTSPGSTTAGTFSLYFDGSDVGLTSHGEDISALFVTTDGDLIINTLGIAYVPGLTAPDQDLLRFTPSSLGSNTSGTWSRYFDGSDVSMGSTEDIWGTWIDENTGEIHLNTVYNYNVGTLSGDSDDIFICDPTSLGDNTSCNFSLFWDGDNYGFGSEQIDGYTIGPMPTGLVFSASVNRSSMQEEMPEIDDTLDDYVPEQIYLPLIMR